MGRFLVQWIWIEAFPYSERVDVNVKKEATIKRKASKSILIKFKIQILTLTYTSSIEKSSIIKINLNTIQF